MTTIRLCYHIESGPLEGTIFEPMMAFVGVKYPLRKTKDLYVPPMPDEEKGLTYPWHCCQDCKNPDFHGGIEALVTHAMLHAGRSLINEKGGKIEQSKSSG